MAAERVLSASSLYSLPYLISVPYLADGSVMRRLKEMREWIEDDASGSSGVYGINYSGHAFDVGFSDPDSAFFFKLRWYEPCPRLGFATLA